MPTKLGLRILVAALACGALPAQAQECGLCAREVVINSSLATCFLDRYAQLASRQAGAVAIDLDDCESNRGVVAALRGPAGPDEAPDTRFMLTLSQLSCLKRKLEEPGLSLDPSARISLGDCR